MPKADKCKEKQYTYRQKEHFSRSNDRTIEISPKIKQKRLSVMPVVVSFKKEKNLRIRFASSVATSFIKAPTVGKTEKKEAII